VYRLFGWKWVLESSSDNNSAQIACVAFLVNTILLAVLGSLFGFVVNGFQRNKQ